MKRKQKTNDFQLSCIDWIFFCRIYWCSAIPNSVPWIVCQIFFMVMTMQFYRWVKTSRDTEREKLLITISSRCFLWVHLHKHTAKNSSIHPCCCRHQNRPYRIMVIAMKTSFPSLNLHNSISNNIVISFVVLLAFFYIFFYYNRCVFGNKKRYGAIVFRSYICYRMCAVDWVVGWIYQFR